MAEWLKNVLWKGSATPPDEDLLRAALQTGLAPSFASAAELSVVSVPNSKNVIVGGRTYAAIASGTADGVIIIADADGRLFQMATLISSAVTTSGASVIFQNLGLENERNLELVFDNIGSDSSSSAYLVAQFSTDGGANWVTSGYYAHGDTMDTSTFTGSPLSTAAVLFGGTTTAGSAAGTWYGRARLFDFGNAAKTTFEGWATETLSNKRGLIGKGVQTTAQSYNALKLFWNTGNFDNGSIQLWRAP